MISYLIVFMTFIYTMSYAAIFNKYVPIMPKKIRVAIYKDLQAFDVIGENVKIFNFQGKKNLNIKKLKAPFRFSHEKEKILINGISHGTKHIIIHSQSKFLKIHDKPFRGVFDIHLYKSGFLIINHVNIEKYLASLLNKEMKSSWPIETLRAQAIAARTYALACMIERINEKYDVETDVRDQVYAGFISEDPRTLEAVKLSEGEVLFFNEKILKTYYHSNSGGHTENPNLIWGGNSLYMPPVYDPYTLNMPGYNWEYEIQTLKLIDLLKNKRKLPFYNFFDIAIGKYSSSGRVENVLIKTEKKVFSITGKEFRELIGETKLKSTKFKITQKNSEKIKFVGRGWGHGAGLSQWGAKKMGDKGLSYNEILKFYYPKLSIKKVW